MAMDNGCRSALWWWEIKVLRIALALVLLSGMADALLNIATSGLPRLKPGGSVLADAPGAAAQLAARVLGVDASQKFSFHPLDESTPCDASVGPCCTVHAIAGGMIRVNGTTAVTMAYCLAQYCKRELLMSFTWERSGGFQVPQDLPSPLPASSFSLQKRCAPGQGHRCHTHYMNVVTSSYSAWNWGWARWEREIDWMALHGIDLVFSFTGQEYIWRETYRELGLNDSQIQSGFNGPAFLAWSRGQGGHQNGGVFHSGIFDYSLSDEFLTGQWNLQKQIVARQTELGIGSVLPAFMGDVPGPLKLIFPHANISGDGSPGSVWLDALDPLFSTIGEKFLGKAIRDFGKTGYYEADGFFGTKAAPWMSVAKHRGGTSAPFPIDSPNRDGHGLPSTHCAPAFSRDEVSAEEPPAAAVVTCVFGAEQKMSYIPGEATDNGKTYKTLAEAKAACQKDIYCGGALSRSCNANNTVCTAFQTRCGMTPCKNAGVPCAGEHPKVLPEPKHYKHYTKGAQNSYPINNTHACGHHAPSAHTPADVDHGWSAHAHAAAVYATMRALDEDAVWVFQGCESAFLRAPPCKIYLHCIIYLHERASSCRAMDERVSRDSNAGLAQ